MKDHERRRSTNYISNSKINYNEYFDTVDTNLLTEHANTEV